MQTPETLSLLRRVVPALGAALVCSVLTLSPAGAWAEAMPDEEFIKLCTDWEYREGRAERVKQALKDGANPNARDEVFKKPALVYVAHDAEVTRALLAAGADVNATDNGGRTALQEHFFGHVDNDLVKLLVGAGADVNAREESAGGRTALMLAAMNGNSAAVKQLLDAGADARARDADGNTPVMYAADPYPKSNDKEHHEIVRLLAAAGADVNARANDGTTALMWAARNGEALVSGALLSAGADGALKDKKGHDALWYARQNKDAQERAAIVRLLQGGAKKPAAQDAGAFGAADLKRMSTFVSNFVEVRFPDFDMTGSGSAPPSPALIYFGIWHNYTNNRASRVKPCAEKSCEHSSLVTEAKFVTESVRKYFDLEVQHRSVSDAVGWFSSHFDGKRYYFEGSDGELLSFARVTRAVREGDIIRMMGDIYLEDEPNITVGSFVATARPHKWNGKDTWAILSLKTKRR